MTMDKKKIFSTKKLKLSSVEKKFKEKIKLRGIIQKKKRKEKRDNKNRD